MQIRPDRQTLLWSATWPRELQAIARQFLREPYQVTIGSTDLKANRAIKQTFLFPEEAAKYTHLIKLLGKEMDGSRLLVAPRLQASTRVHAAGR